MGITQKIMPHHEPLLYIVHTGIKKTWLELKACISIIWYKYGPV